MSEIHDRARQIAAENQAAQQRRLEQEVQQRSTEEIERRISRQRAEEFAETMRAHSIEKIALAQIGKYHRVPVLKALNNEWKNSFVGDLLTGGTYSYQILQEMQGRRLTVVRLGWLAMQPYARPSYDDSVYPATSVFVSEDATTFNCSDVDQSRGVTYVTPISSPRVGGPRPMPDDRALGSDEAVQRMGQRLVELGIVK